LQMKESAVDACSRICPFLRSDSYLQRHPDFEAGDTETPFSVRGRWSLHSMVSEFDLGSACPMASR
jgi:hypothetical protein